MISRRAHGSGSRLPATFEIDGYCFSVDPVEAGLHVVSTPIGNLMDITLRALNVLAAADFVACEDTRVTSRLLQRYAIATRLHAYHDHNAGRMRPKLLNHMSSGGSIALVSDAGTPVVSDPGFKLVRACVEAGIKVDVIPGPSAPVTALVLSAMASDRFHFAGFLPARRAARKKMWMDLSRCSATLVVFEAGSRLKQSLQDAVPFLQAREMCVAREMTKLHQETLRGTAGEVLAELENRHTIKGEVTLVIGPADPRPMIDHNDLRDHLQQLLQHHSASKAASLLAHETGRPRSEIYALALQLKSG